MLSIHQQIPSDTLETSRMLLKAVTPEVIAKVFSLANDHDISRFMGYISERELQTEREKFKTGLTMHNRTFFNFLLIKKADGKVIGRCGFHTWMPMHSRAEIGYGMCGEEFMGQGYMKEAMWPIVTYGFEKLELNRIEAFIGSRNEASLRLVKGLGFKEEGILREHYCKNGVIEDSVCFGLLRREFL